MEMKTTNTSSRPVVVIGMFLYNEERHVAEAIESLLSQTYRNFSLVILNDCSTDKTGDIVSRYAQTDRRIHYFENSRRMGYSENYRRCFRLAQELTENGVDYLAWAAGHDRYHKEWLKEMVHVLNMHPDVVMVYPDTVRISEEGDVLPVVAQRFDTFGLSVYERIQAICSKEVVFGNMIYGLFRAEALVRADIFPPLLVPDLVLLMRLTLFGSYFQVNKKLWFRRYVNISSIARQKRTVFSRAPFYAHIPWPIVTALYLLWKTYIHPSKANRPLRKYGPFLCTQFLRRYYPLVKYHYPKYGKYMMIPYSIITHNGIIAAINKIKKGSR